jgi:alkanesulfonate monooxygenase SsuD/methylene tetrahydromethanopterin reductase-like flavin-dependent oxidoreductase (luciferase family)
MSSPSLYAVGAGARTKRLRIGPMGYIVPLYHPLRLAEEIAIVDQMLGGRMELGLVPGINADYFRPFGLDYGARKSPTLEFIDYMRAAFGEVQPFSFHGQEFHTDSAKLAVQPAQRPHPPLWMMSRDPQTLEFCARHAINPGYFLVYPRVDAAHRYRKFLQDWKNAGWSQKPNIAYCTVVYVDETDEKAIETALFRASRAYEGFLPPPQPGETFDERARRHAQMFIGRGEPGASEIMANVFNPDYLLKHELIFIGSPDTVAAKIRAAAEAGLFNTFMGEFNFADLPEPELLRSIRLFGEKVIPALRGYEPF